MRLEQRVRQSATDRQTSQQLPESQEHLLVPWNELDTDFGSTVILKKGIIYPF